eukprot:3140485-Prymnesium_polylepis.2
MRTAQHCQAPANAHVAPLTSGRAGTKACCSSQRPNSRRVRGCSGCGTCASDAATHLVQLDHTGAYLISSHELILVGAVEAFKIEGAIAVHPLVDLRMPFLSPQLVQLGSSRLRLLVCSINSTVWARRVFVPQITQ